MPKITGKYETVFIVDVNLGEENIAAMVEKFKTLIEANGTVTNVNEWGKRRLAYPINDMNEGYYTLIEFESKPEFPRELDRIYNITDGVMRSLIVAHEYGPGDAMLNKAILMGRLVAEPELRHTPNNIAVASFTLAVDRTYGQDKQTDFLDIVAWRSTAEFVSKWFHKGMLVAVSGRIQTRNWEDKQGNKRKSVEVVADEVYFAESKKDSQPRRDDSAIPFDVAPSVSDFSELSADDSELPF